MDTTGLPNELMRAGAAALERLSAFLGDSLAGCGPTVNAVPPADALDALDAHRWLGKGGMADGGFEGFLDQYLALATRLHHPGYLAHQVAMTDTPAALAELVHGVINNPMAVYEMGPAAAALEHAVINWMLAKVGWPPEPLPGHEQNRVDDGAPHAGGVLTHGGSLANLTALLAARAAVAPEAWERGTPRDLVVLAPAASHYSIARAVAILGLGARAVVPLPVDERQVVRGDQVANAIRGARAHGQRPMAVVVNACSTGTGLHDPIDEVADACDDAGVWLHVDACHGASALLSARERHHLRGIDRASSIVWDAHKMLRTSSLCAAVLVRESDRLAAAFRQRASYLFYDHETEPALDFIHRTIECTKAELGLKLFLAVAWRGEAALADYIDDRYAATRRFAQIIRDRPGFECPFEPETNILCFRHGADNDRQLAIRERLRAAGRFLLSSTDIDGHRYLRLAVMSTATDESTIAALLDDIEASS